jgi:hypothetical protein
MKNLSENAESRKRGRPRLFTDRMARSIDDSLPYTRRHQQNRFYATLFAGTVSDERCISDLGWLFEGHDKPRYKRVILLAELGRLAFSNHPEAIQIANALATVIAMQQMATRQGLTLIREQRRQMKEQEQSAGHPVQLASEIIRAINEYSRGHADTKQHTIVRALRIVEYLTQKTPDWGQM